MLQQPPTDRAKLAQWIHERAQALGFPLVGITHAQKSPYENYIRQWLAAGRHGSMAYLAKNLEKRLDPAKLVPGARSVICVAEPYASQPLTETHQKENSPRLEGKIARYAWGRDYHKTIGKRLKILVGEIRKLFPEHVFRVCVDTAPILERELAARAGLGWIGKNTLLIHPQFGSYLLLGEIVTTLELPPDRDNISLPISRCGTCRRCLEACPSRCLEPYQINASQCISYLTIEHRGAVDPSFFPLIDQWLAGCDICQEVCPFNQRIRRKTAAKAFQNQGLQKNHGQVTDLARNSVSLRLTESLAIQEVLSWSAQDRQKTLAGSALKRLNLTQLKRNALIVAGNLLRRIPHRELLAQIQQLARDKKEEDLVRQTAEAVLRSLGAQAKDHV